MRAEGLNLHSRLCEHLALIYPASRHGLLAGQLLEAMQLPLDCPSPQGRRNLWDQRDSVLITYGNSIVNSGQRPLQTLHHFLRAELTEVFSAVHILPFFPHSSDDGFAVMDYLSVNPALGEWEDISAIAADYQLMADLVINHASSRSRWFDNFKKRVDPGRDYFVEADPAADYSAVVRPRSTPLLNTVQTADGERHVWCTFSPDQVDLNFSNPRVLLEFAGIIRRYLERGVQCFRMDAVAFLWKQAGTDCMHLPQTHAIIKLLRTLIEHHSPEAVVVTETNVPNRENLVYFGNADEAHLIYNFSLPPLVLYTLLSGNCRHLKNWMMSMPPAQWGTAYLNFIASHDGIGLRPLDGLLSEQEKQQLLDCMRGFGGRITMRRAREGNLKPYEINIALFDAMRGTMAGGADDLHRARFLCAHLIMLALEGIPALYINSLFAAENDYRRLEHTGHNRSINRHRWRKEELLAALADPDRHHRPIFDYLRRCLRIRRAQPAFHPNAAQLTLHLGDSIFAFWRQSISRNQSIFCLNNVTAQTRRVSLSAINLIGTDRWWDLLSGEECNQLDAKLSLAPYQCVWLSNLDQAGLTGLV